jgi:hypothetical protein
MMSFMRTIIFSLLALTLTASCGLCSLGGNLTEELEPLIVGQVNQTDRVLTAQEGNLLLQLRTLGIERVFWTRMAIASLIQDSDDRSFLQNRLRRNSGDMIEIVGPYFGSEKSEQYGDLIDEQMNITVEVVNAAKDADQIALVNASQKWFENADEISLLENRTVSGLSFEARKAEWRDLLNLTKNETMQMLSRDHNASIDTMDRIGERVIMMADSLADAIISMNPERFHNI